MFLAQNFGDLELRRIWNLPFETMVKWISYFQRMLKHQEEALKTSSQKVAPAKSITSVNEHSIQFR